MPKRKPSDFRFDPDSFNAQFATMLAKQEAMHNQFGADLKDIKEQTAKTNGRVTVLEQWRDTTQAKFAGMALVIGGAGGVLVWLVQIVF